MAHPLGAGVWSPAGGLFPGRPGVSPLGPGSRIFPITEVSGIDTRRSRVTCRIGPNPPAFRCLGDASAGRQHPRCSPVRPLPAARLPTRTRSGAPGIRRPGTVCQRVENGQRGQRDGCRRSIAERLGSRRHRIGWGSGVKPGVWTPVGSCRRSSERAGGPVRGREGVESGGNGVEWGGGTRRRTQSGRLGRGSGGLGRFRHVCGRLHSLMARSWGRDVGGWGGGGGRRRRSGPARRGQGGIGGRRAWVGDANRGRAGGWEAPPGGRRKSGTPRPACAGVSECYTDARFVSVASRVPPHGGRVRGVRWNGTPEQKETRGPESGTSS